MRSLLTQTFKRVTGMIDYVRENLDEEEYDLFLDLIVPEPEPEPKKVATKKTKTLRFEHCDACNYTKRHQVHKDNSRSDYHEFQSAKGAMKSRRAKSIETAIKDGIQRAKDAAAADEKGLCVAGIDSKGETCGEFADHNIHHLATHPDYHEFVEGKSHALAAGEGS